MGHTVFPRAGTYELRKRKQAMETVRRKGLFPP